MVSEVAGLMVIGEGCCWIEEGADDGGGLVDGGVGLGVGSSLD